MKTLGNLSFKRFRYRLARWIFPGDLRESLEEVEIRSLKINSYSKDNSIPKEHYEKMHIEMFKLIDKNIIVDLTGLKKGSIFETTISYIERNRVLK